LVLRSTVTSVCKFPFCFGIRPIGLGPGVAQWLKRCATSRTVPGSIPGGVTGIFSDIFPSDCTMALGSTQPLVKMSTRNLSGGKCVRCVWLTTSPPFVSNVMEFGSLNLLEPSGLHRACYGNPLPLTCLYSIPKGGLYGL
jgi:hypothetical protein